MDQEGKNEALLRKYLLGELNEADEQALEEQLLADDERSELLLAEEDELVDDYLSGELSEGEGERFDIYFLSTPERRRKLKFGEALSRTYAERVVENPDSEDSKLDRAAASKDQGAKDSEVKESASNLPPPVLRPPSPVVIGPPSWWRRAPSSPYLMAAAAVIVLAVGLGSWRAYLYFRSPQVSKGIASLREAYRDQRPTEARITDLNYAPPPPTTRGPERDKFDYVALDRAKALIQLDANEHPSAQSYHDLGRLYLAQGDFDKAIDQFEKAFRLDEKNAQLDSDLGVAHFEKGKLDSTEGSGQGLEEFARSLDQFNKALELDGSLLEALFNRALVHQAMKLPKQAEEDWREYLRKEPTSRWADEARENLRLLEERQKSTSWTKEEILREFLGAYETRDDDRAWRLLSQTRDALSGKMIWEQLVDQYLDALTAGKIGDAITNLEALSYVGELEFKRAGDSFTSGLARYYKSLSHEGLQRVGQARQLMKLGSQSFADGKLREAADTFAKCKQEFSASGDRWEAEYAEQWTGYCYLQSSLTQRSLAIFDPLVRSAEREGHKWLLMRTLHLLSGAEYNLGIYSKAIDRNHRSLALAEEIGDRIGVFNASSILAEQYRYIDNYRKSLGCIETGLSIIESCALSPSQITQHYAITASCLMSSGLYGAAIDYQKEGLSRALTVGRPRTITMAYMRLGQIYGKAGNPSEGIDNVRLAYETAKSLPTESVRKTMMALSSLAIGDLYRETHDFNKALDSYDEALTFYEDLDFQFGVYEAHKNRLICFLAKGDDWAADVELKTTLSLIEDHRSTILEGDNRNGFFESAQSIYDIAIDFAFSRMHDQERAFEYSEESRSRSLLDSMGGNARLSGNEHERDISFDSFKRPLKLAELTDRLPKQAQIVQYAVLDDKILIWVVSKARPLLIVPKEIAQHELTDKVRAYLQVIASGSETKVEEANIYADDLFDWLIRPVEKSLNKGAPLYIVPDKILNYLPFGALRSSDSGRFLVEDYLPVISPSSSLLVICSEIATKKRGAEVEERILSVGNPRIDRSEFPGLANLPSAAEEAEEVAGYYNSRCVLVGDAAKEKRVKAEMQRADVIHLAVHSLLDDRWPLHSKLLLTREPKATADEDSSDGVLEAQEVYQLQLSRAKVVVLSACETGVAHYYGGEGVISFARPFLSRGVPLVVVSLWKVDSDATAKLMCSLHRHRRRGNVSTAEALVLAQREMIHSTERGAQQARSWAAFIAVGGATSF